MNAIEVRNLTKKFGSTVALNNANVTFAQGKIYGLLGRNGAGKTTMMNTITNRIFADEGTVTIDGKTVGSEDAALENIFMMGEKNYYPDSMKVKDIFRWSKEFYPKFDTDYAVSLTEKFKLDLSKRFKALSTGYHSIAKVIIAMSVGTDYVIFDEPVLGMDANHRELFYRELIESYSNKPRTIILSTHLIEEVANLIEDVIIIKNGEILLQKPCEELLSESYTVTGPATAVDAFAEGKDLIGEDTLGGIKSVYLAGKADKSTLPSNLEIGKADLQKLFIRLTNE